MTDRDQLKADDQARRTALDPGTSFIVQAPAGSGKTELLIQRYLRLLDTVEHPEEVLAITFTNKAAAEMRIRVVEALARAKNADQPEAAHERLTYDLSCAVLQRDEALSWGLAQNDSRLRIQTLDSLNAHIAAMQPLTTSSGTAGNAIPTEAQLDALYERAAAATLDYLADAGPFRDAAANVLSHLDSDTGLYIRYLAAMLKTRDQWLPLIGGGIADADSANAARRALENTLRAIVADTLLLAVERLPSESEGELLSVLRFAAGNLRAARSASPVAGLDGIEDLPGGSAEDLADWDAIRACLLKADGSPFKSVNKNHGFPVDNDEQRAFKERYYELSEALSRAPGFFDVLHQVKILPAPAYTDEQWEVLTALLNLLQLATIELRDLFRQRAAVDYIEVAMNADVALGTPDAPGDVALLLDYRLRHILVDEMQDTSIAQYRMLRALTAGWETGDGRTLFCVGDPMQSIYRFRNAEVAQFLISRKEGIGDVSLQSLLLQRNFRSGSELVDWFNTVFARVLSDSDDAQTGAVSYSAAVSAEHLHGKGSVHVHPVIGSDEVVEAEKSMEVLQSILQERPEDSVAVLVRGRGQLRELIPLLRHHEIDFRAVDIDRLTDLPEVIDLLALTRATVHPGDRHAWLAFLRAPWIGLSWRDLHALVRNNRSSTVPQLLRDDERLAALSDYGRQALERAGPAIESMLSDSRSETLRSRIERLWLLLGGPVSLSDSRVIDNVYRFLDVLTDLEQSGTLADVAELESQLDKERVSTVSDARLQIMTMHKAKGLQFDHVLLHGLGRRPAASKTRVLNWMDSASEGGDERRVLAPVGRRDMLEKDRIHQYIGETEKLKEQFEKQRLLYVACTRSRESLHLVGHASVNEKTDELRPPESGSLLALLWPMLRDRFEDAFAAGEFGGAGSHNVEWLLPRLRRIDEGWSAPPLSPLPTIAEPAGVGEDSVEFYWAGAEAKLAGTLVHRWLQWAAEGRVLLKDLTEDQRATLGRRWLAEQGHGDSAGGPVLERVEAAIASVLGDDRGAWMLEGEGHTELALTGLIDGKLQTGIIDRVRIDGDEHWIIDYKTSTHEGGDLARFLSEERRRYSDQLAGYASLYEGWSGVRPRCALYFPLLQEFVEMPVATR
ncbi:MAG: UvrD-helicase domain-containing protein [Woeseiaceae bacterium]|nr:UvrD-helicase domain-containing protein [Woeseiaceae bacterium]